MVRLYEIATQVEVTDKGRKYFYWVTQSRPEKATRAALKKHGTLMGLGGDVLGNLPARVVGTSTHDVSSIGSNAPDAPPTWN